MYAYTVISTKIILRKNSLFRKEALNHQRNHWLGKALLVKGIPASLVLMLTISFIFLFLVMVIKGDYTRRITVQGEIVSKQQAITILAPQQGIVNKSFVTIGQVVEKGTPLYELDISKTTHSGNVSQNSAEKVIQQIELTNDIINKLRENKISTLTNLEVQLKKYRESYDNNKILVSNSLRGLQDMRTSMKSYDEYLKKGLISKEQSYNQRYLFYQQQSSWQNMNSQLIQEGLKIINLETEITTTSTDFDNRISEYELKLSELKRYLAEVDAGGTLIITAPVTGKVENLALTEGQMFSLGDSLVQILPGNQQHYQLMLWLPNHSLPFVHENDSVNIRYDAYPFEKYGQFSGTISSLSRLPATESEIMHYSGSRPEMQHPPKQAYYRTLVTLDDQVLIKEGKTLPISNGMSAEVTLFLEKRPLYQWILSPYYDIKRSVGGPING